MQCKDSPDDEHIGEGTMNAEEVRAIVREELREAFRVLGREADRFPDYDTDTLEDVTAYTVQKLADKVEEKLRHTPECVTRTSGRYYDNCDCGVRS